MALNAVRGHIQNSHIWSFGSHKKHLHYQSQSCHLQIVWNNFLNFWKVKRKNEGNFLGKQNFSITNAFIIIVQEALKTWRWRLLKNLKTPFFSRYSKFLLIGNWYWSKTSPKFFSKKKFQQLRSLELSKIWAEMGRCGQADWATAKIFSSN